MDKSALILVLASASLVWMIGLFFLAREGAAKRAELEKKRLKALEELAEKARQREERRKAAVLKNRVTWGDEVCKAIIAKKVAPHMTPEMVILAWGEPSSIDQKEITARGKTKERWVYGTPRRGANYVYFKD